MAVPEGNEIQLETVVEKLEHQISEQIDNKNPNVKKLMADMRERRKEIHQDPNKKNAIKIQPLALSSSSKPGKLYESMLCRQFTALQTNNRDKQQRPSSKKSQS